MRVFAHIPFTRVQVLAYREADTHRAWGIARAAIGTGWEASLGLVRVAVEVAEEGQGESLIEVVVWGRRVSLQWG